MIVKASEIVLQRFADFGAAPTKTRHVAQFDPETTLRHPGIAVPIGSPPCKTNDRGPLHVRGFRAKNGAARQD